MSHFTLSYLLYLKLFSAFSLRACFRKEKEVLSILLDETRLERGSFLDSLRAVALA